MNEVGVLPEIARWWRKRARDDRKTYHVPSSTNSRTLLLHITRSEDGQTFIKQRIKQLEQSLKLEDDPVDRCKLALFYEKDLTEEPSKGLATISQAIHRLEPSHPLAGPMRRTCLNLSYKDFILEYAVPGIPVLLKGGASVCFAQGSPWTLDQLKQALGSKTVPLKRHVAQSVSWARLEEAGQRSLANFMDQVFNRNPGQAPPDLYLHDWSLPQNCQSPEAKALLNTFQVPSYFAGDILQRLGQEGLMYTDSWPSLFVGPAGTRSDTHVDGFGSNFWMVLLEGEKQWTICPRQSTSLLYPVWVEGCHDPVFEADMTCPDAEEHPAAYAVRGWQCSMQKGDVLFVPAGSAHHVVNLADSLALSCNYVDATNLKLAQDALAEQGLKDHRASQLAPVLTAADNRLCSAQEHLLWQEHKSWPALQGRLDWALPQDHAVLETTGRRVPGDRVNAVDP